MANVIADSSWAPDGKVIAAVIFDQDKRSISAVISIDPDTGARKTISTPQATVLNNVSWLPNGKALCETFT